MKVHGVQASGKGVRRDRKVDGRVILDVDPGRIGHALDPTGIGNGDPVLGGCSREHLQRGRSGPGAPQYVVGGAACHDSRHQRGGVRAPDGHIREVHRHGRGLIDEETERRAQRVAIADVVIDDLQVHGLERIRVQGSGEHEGHDAIPCREDHLGRERGLKVDPVHRRTGHDQLYRIGNGQIAVALELELTGRAALVKGVVQQPSGVKRCGDQRGTGEAASLQKDPGIVDVIEHVRDGDLDVVGLSALHLGRSDHGHREPVELHRGAVGVVHEIAGGGGPAHIGRIAGRRGPVDAGHPIVQGVDGDGHRGARDQGDVLRPVLKGTRESGSADEEAEHIVVVRAHELRVLLTGEHESEAHRIPRRHEVELQHGIVVGESGTHDLFQVRVGGKDRGADRFRPGVGIVRTQGHLDRSGADEHTLSKPDVGRCPVEVPDLIVQHVAWSAIERDIGDGDAIAQQDVLHQRRRALGGAHHQLGHCTGTEQEDQQQGGRTGQHHRVAHTADEISGNTPV